MSKKDTFKDDAKAILKSSKLPFLNFPSCGNWEMPSRTKYLYYRLKSHAKYFLNIEKLINIEKIKADLVSVYKLIDVGKEHFQKELELKNFDIPPALYLEYLRGEQSGQDWPQDFYIGYILLAMLDVVEFENMMTSLSSNISHDSQEANSVLLKATSVLMDAQVSLELGIAGYEKNRGDTYSERYKYILENYSSGIKAEYERKKSNQKIRKDWLPVILDVKKRVDEGRGVSESCGHVLNKFDLLTGNKKDDEKKQKALRQQYYKWLTSPDQYL